MGHRLVVILTGESLFAEGIASRLSQFPHKVTVEVVDPESSDCMARISAQQPAVIIVDASDALTMELCPLNRLIATLPDLKVIHLDSQKDQIRVVTSEQHPVAEVQDLIEMIE
jgi:DNA-binding NarL/FixJ family response regulator